MYLYNLSEEKIEVYEFAPNIEKIKEYKIKKMKNIPRDNRILKAFTSNNKILENPYNDIYYEDLVNDDNDHRLECYELSKEEETRQQELLNKYYLSKFTSNRVAIIKHDNKKKKDQYFIITSLYRANLKQEYCMPDIIHIPKSLYLLQMLEQGKFDVIQKEQIEEVLSLFDLKEEPIFTFNVDKLNALFDSGLVRGNSSDIIKKARSSTKILSKIKKK